MRTLRQKIEQSVLKTLGLDGRPYKVEGTITFVFIPPVPELDIQSLRDQILEVDRLWPWKDAGGADSLICLSDGETAIDHWHTPEQKCWFTFHPGVSLLAKGQLHAYEKYLVKLARELSLRSVSKPAYVRARISILRVYEFTLKDPCLGQGGDK